MISATANLIGTITATAVIFATQTGGCADATVENSDATFTHDIASGATYVLTDETITIQLDSITVATSTFPAITNPTILINWN